MNLSTPLPTEGALLAHIYRHQLFCDAVPDSIRSDIQDYFAEPRFPAPKLDPNDSINQMVKFSNLAIEVIFEEEVQAGLGSRSGLVPSDLEAFERVWASILSKPPLERFADGTYTAEALASRHEEWSGAEVIEACIARDAALGEQLVVEEQRAPREVRARSRSKASESGARETCLMSEVIRRLVKWISLITCLPVVGTLLHSSRASNLLRFTSFARI